jgi:hypothetical protein
MRGIGGMIELSSQDIHYEIKCTEIAFDATTFFGRVYKGGVYPSWSKAAFFNGQGYF